MKQKMRDLISQYDKGRFTYSELEWELLNLFNVIVPEGTLCDQEHCKEEAKHITYTEHLYKCDNHK